MITTTTSSTTQYKPNNSSNNYKFKIKLRSLSNQNLKQTTQKTSMNVKKNKNRVNMKMKNKKITQKKKKMIAKQTQYKYYKQIIFTGKKTMIKINTKNIPYKIIRRFIYIQC